MRCPPTILFALLLVASPAAAERLQGGYVAADPDLTIGLEPHEVTYNTVYLNGCFNPGDCDIRYGQEDSSTNRSSIAEGTLSEFAYGQVTWDAVVECVRKTYEPFGVVITDEDPGAAPHWEAMVAGYPEEIGMEGAGGVSPWRNCRLIDTAITFSFANIYQGSVDNICWTASQEIAHAFGLDHQFLCEDPMTYRQDCPDRKFFHNVEAPCGEWSTRSCECPGSGQNSFQRITDVFGPGTIEEPTVVIEAPTDGTVVAEGFPVVVEVGGEVPVTRVEVYVNGVMQQVMDSPPYEVEMPRDMSDGRMKVEVRAYNAYQAVGKKVVTVVQNQPCAAAADCADGETCVDGRCVVGPGEDGGLGETCEGNHACVSGMCGTSDEGKFCAETCEVGARGCPDGFGCLEVDGAGLCWKGYDDRGGGGCAAGGRGGLVSLALALALMLVRRRRAP